MSNIIHSRKQSLKLFAVSIKLHDLTGKGSWPMMSRFSLGAFRSIVCAFAVASFAVGSQAATTFTDGDFVNWNTVLISSTGGASATIDRQLSGGNPGFYESVTYSVPKTFGPGGRSGRIGAFNPLFVWRPAVDGALAAMHFSMETRSISSSFSFTDIGYIRPAIIQGGTVFTDLYSDITVSTGGDWVKNDRLLDSASDWVQFSGSAKPDFSINGADIVFGFRYHMETVCNGPNGCRSASAVVGVDNYSVTLTGVSTVPLPQTYTMLLAGLGLVGFMARRGNQNVA